MQIIDNKTVLKSVNIKKILIFIVDRQLITEQLQVSDLPAPEEWGLTPTTPATTTTTWRRPRRGPSTDRQVRPKFQFKLDC